MDGKHGPEPTDDQMLARLGKKQVLKRRFGVVSIFGFAIAELITWETVLVLFEQSYENGGPSGAFYGYIIASLSTLSVYIVISELASMAPIAGGQYYWVYMMAPLRWKKISSYLIGWLTSLAWIATIATESIFLGTIIEGLIKLEQPQFEVQRWHNTLWSWAMVAVAIFINIIIPNTLPKFEIIILVLHLLGFVAITAVLLALSPKASPEFVFHTVANGGNWPSQGISYCIGFIGNVATFVGADASIHMAEEIENAAINLPRAIVGGMSMNTLLGFSMMLTILFCLGPDAKTVNSILGSDTGFPYIQLFYNSTQSYAGTAVMTSIGIVLTMACSVGITTTASRMTWSFARDYGLPFSRFILKVSNHNKVPVVAVFVVCAFACALTLIYIGSTTAFNDVISLTVTAFYGSYLFPSAMLLYHRVKGNVLPHGTLLQGQGIDGPNSLATTAKAIDAKDIAHTPISDTIEINPNAAAQDGLGGNTTIPEKSSARPIELNVAEAPLIWGPWKIPGILGTLNNLYACLYMIFVIFWSTWPPATPVNYTTMNYSIVVTVGVLIVSGVWYIVRGRTEYKGPLIDDEVAAIMHIAV